MNYHSLRGSLLAALVLTFHPPSASAQTLSAPEIAVEVAEQEVGVSSDGFLTLTYFQDKTSTGLLFYLQASSSLLSWSTPNATTTSTEDAGDFWRITLRDTVPVSEADRRFLRLKIMDSAGLTTLLFPPTSLWGSWDWDGKILRASLSWSDNSPIETGFSVERSLGSGFQAVATTASDTAHYLDPRAAPPNSTATYRVRALAPGEASAYTNELTLTTPLDTDLDGIPDEFELGESYAGAPGTYATSPYSFSSGGSGISDGWLIRYGLDPFTADPSSDDDEDGLSLAEEAEAGTDPNLEDTDGDSVLDGADAVGDDPDFKHPRLPETHYAVVEINPPDAPTKFYPFESYSGSIMNNSCQIVGWEKEPGRGSWAAVWDGAIRALSVPAQLPFPDLIDLGYETDLWSPRYATSINDRGEMFGRIQMTWVGPRAPSVDEAAFPYYVDQADPDHLLLWTLANGVLEAHDVSKNGPRTEVRDAAGNLMSIQPGFEGWPGLIGNSGAMFGHFGFDQGVIRFDRENPAAVLLQDNTEPFFFRLLYDVTESDEVVGTLLTESPIGYIPSGFVYADGAETVFAQETWFEGANQLDPNVDAAGNSVPIGTYIVGSQDGEGSVWLRPGGTGAWKRKPVMAEGRNVSPGYVNSRGEMLGAIVGIGEFGLWRNGKFTELATLLGPDSVWSITNCLSLNDHGVILAYGKRIRDANGNPIPTTDETEWVPLLLLPVDIVPDFNRDGVIDNKDRGKVTEEKPWRFWVNDDDDEGEVGGGNDSNSDLPAAPRNGEDQDINGIRDLVDFFPLWLDIKQMLRVLPKDQFDYVLESENNALQYVETALTKEDSDAYLRAELGEVSQRNNPNGLASVAVKTITLGLAKLSDAFLQGVTDENGGVLLIEAWKATDKPLKLVIKKKGSGEQMCEFPFHLKIDEVEKMFRHKNIREAVPAWAGRVPGEADRLSEPENYPDTLCIEKNFIFVHGYNVNGDQARGWHAEVFKRMFWSGSKARFYGVSWSGDRDQGWKVVVPGLRTPNFHRSVADAFSSASALAQFVNSMEGDTTIAAHSLGNLLTAAAQTDHGMSVANFYMVNAAQSLEQYQANIPASSGLTHGDWTGYQQRVWASEWHLLFDENDPRRALTWRGRVATHSGTRYNFYSDVSNGLGDHVMRTPADQVNLDAVIQFTAFRGAWEGRDADGREAFCLQERLKGRFTHESLGSAYGGWLLTDNYNEAPSPVYRTPTPTEAEAMTNGQLRSSPVFDPGFYIRISPPSPDGRTRFVRSGAPSWIEDLTDSTDGSQAAQQNRNLLLSEMFPARSLAVGGNAIPSFGARNIDMQSTMHIGWPASRTSGNEPVAWWHGDLKDVGYTYVFPLFDAWVDKGGLK